MDKFWVGIAVSLIGAGLGVIAEVFDMDPLMRSIVGGCAIAMVVVGLGILAYGTAKKWQMQGRERGRLIIHHAMYGLGPGQDRDVTECVRGLMERGKLRIEVRPETFLIKDPYPNKTKSLRVTCSYDGKGEVTIQRTDYQHLNLPYDIDY